MGTGKTLAAITFTNILRRQGDVKRVLTVCPNTLKYNWAGELKHSRLPWDVIIIEGSGPARKQRLEQIAKTEFAWAIVNYEALVGLAKELKEAGFDMIVGDEAHQIKNPKAQKTKALKAIPTRFRLAMTGTPVAQNPLDVWSIFDWIRPGYLGKSFYAFRARYADVYNGAGFPMIRGFKNLPELKRRLDPFSIRFLKTECLSLPPKMHQTIAIDLPPAEMRLYKQMADHMLLELGDAELAATTVLTKLMKLQQITSGFVYFQHEDSVLHHVGDAKITALRDLLESLAGQKVVIWCHLKEELRRISNLLADMKRQHRVLASEMSEEERQHTVRCFNEATSDEVFVGNVRLGGVGINLTGASHCVYFSNTWSLVERQQSEDRLHRYGQKGTAVNYYDLVARGTIDEYVLSVLQKKVKMSDKLTGDDVKRMIAGNP